MLSLEQDIEQSVKRAMIFADFLDKLEGVPPSSRGRAGRASHEAAARLHHPATIPNAENDR